MAFLKKNTFFVIGILICLTFITMSCEQTILGPEPKNTPEDNFEILWQDFDNYYALFDVKKVDWKAIYNTYRPRVNSHTSEDDLWTIFTEMLFVLHDSHVAIYNSDYSRHYKSGILNGLVRDDFNSAVVGNYIDGRIITAGSNYLHYGKLKNHNIGYLHIYSFDFDDESYKDIDNVINYLKDVNSLIIDLRGNSGGHPDPYRYIASTFIDQGIPYFYSRFRSGPKHTDFEQPTLLSVEPRAGQYHFTKNIALLTNRFTSSASEHFTWIFKNYVPYVTQIGDTTTGVFSSRFPVRRLPNGWYYVFSSELITSLDGIAMDSTNGIVPDILVMNKKEYSNVGIDSVMERSIQYLEGKK